MILENPSVLTKSASSGSDRTDGVDISALVPPWCSDLPNQRISSLRLLFPGHFLGLHLYGKSNEIKTFFLPERCKPPCRHRRGRIRSRHLWEQIHGRAAAAAAGLSLSASLPRKFGRLRPEGGVGRSRSRPIRKAQEWKGGRERTPRTPTPDGRAAGKREVE